MHIVWIFFQNLNSFTKKQENSILRTLQYFEILICAGEALFDIVSFVVFLHPWSISLAMQDAEYLNKGEININYQFQWV